jgi:hypothetical protein
MFGRRRHAAPAAAPIVTVAETVTVRPRLAEEQIFELVHTRIAAAIGEGGEWVVRRRTPEDTDDLFRTVLAHQVALDVTAALRSAQLQLEAGEPLTVATREGAMVLRSTPGTGAASDAVASPADAAVTDDATAGSTNVDVDDSSTTSGADASGDFVHSRNDDGPAHRHDEPEADEEAELDEDAIALQWEPAPITVWTDLKRPVTGPIAMQLSSSDLVTPSR